jgi:TonB family protein
MMPVANDATPAADPTRMGRPRRVEVVVVSGDDEFLIEIGPLFSEGFRSRPVDSPAAIDAVLTEQGSDAPPTMILLDAGAVADARATVSQLESAHPRLPIVVVAATRDESYWSAAIARGAIIDVVARHDLTGDGFKEILKRADSRARSASQAPPPGEAAPPPKGSSKVLIAVAVVVAVGAGAFFMFHRSGSSGPVVPAANVTASQSGAAALQAAKPTSSPLELLSAARVAFRDQKLLPRDGESHGDSALELYAQVLAQDPTNDEAIDGMQRLFTVMKSRVQSDLAAGKLDDAQRLISEFKATNVDADGAKELDAQFVAARPKYYAARATEMIQSNDFVEADAMITQLATLDRKGADDLRRTLEARKVEQATQTQLAQLSASVKQAIDAGNLIEPANDSARSRLNAMRQVSRTHPLTLSAQRDLQASLLSHAQDQASKEQFEAASKLLTAAGDIAVTPEVTEAKKQLQGEIDAASQRAAAAAVAKKAADAAQAAAAKEQGAASAAAAAPTYLAARPTAPLKVVYPTNAMENKVQGYVVVEFMLMPDGRPQTPTVVDSSPARVFDKAAIEAVMGGRYDSSRLTNAQPQHARVRITFRPS